MSERVSCNLGLEYDPEGSRLIFFSPGHSSLFPGSQMVERKKIAEGSGETGAEARGFGEEGVHFSSRLCCSSCPLSVRLEQA